VVRRRNNGDQNDSRIRQTEDKTHGSGYTRKVDFPPAAEKTDWDSSVLMPCGERERDDRRTDQQTVSEMQTRHGCELVTELIRGPDGGLAIGTVDGVDEAVVTGFLGGWTVVFWITEETGRHAWPGSEDDEGEEV